MTNQIITLANKLRVAVDVMRDVETVSVAVFVNSGSRNETKANNGISHFLEHMAFKGTKTRSAKQIAEQFDNIGGHINAYTSRERTVYYAKILKQDIQFAVEFLSDILQNSIFAKDELEKERGVILQEIAMTNDTPDDIIYDYFQATAFPNQPLGRPILGPEENVKKFTKQDLSSYINNQYNNSDIVIVAAGNIDEQKFVGYVKKYFTNLGKGKIKKTQAAKYHGGDFRKEKDLEQVNLLLGFEGISYLDEDFYKCQILAGILGGGMSSRLFQEVREKRGLAYSIYAFNYANHDCGLFGIYAGTTPDKANKLIDVATDQLLTTTDKITITELKRAVSQLKAGLLMASESTNSRMQKLGGNILSYGRIISNEEIIKRISQISKEDLSELARKIISRGKPSLAAIGKVKNITDYQKIQRKFN